MFLSIFQNQAQFHLSVLLREHQNRQRKTLGRKPSRVSAAAYENIRLTDTLIRGQP